MNKLALFGVVAAMTAVAAPASAATSLFAQYKQTANSANTIQWTRTSNTAGTLSNLPTAGFGAYSVVNFNYSNSALATALGNVSAKFKLNAVNDGIAATTVLFGQTIIGQEVKNGTFEFLSMNPLTVGSTNYAAGSILLKGSFTGTISGLRNGNGGFVTMAASNFMSDFVSFTPGSTLAFSMDLAQVSGGGLNRPNASSVLRNFNTPTTGSFLSDPAPIVNAIPEPQIWGLLVVGFGLVGVQTRRRSRSVAIAA